MNFDLFTPEEMRAIVRRLTPLGITVHNEQGDLKEFDYILWELSRLEFKEIGELRVYLVPMTTYRRGVPFVITEERQIKERIVELSQYYDYEKVAK